VSVHQGTPLGFFDPLGSGEDISDPQGWEANAQLLARGRAQARPHCHGRCYSFPVAENFHPLFVCNIIFTAHSSKHHYRHSGCLTMLSSPLVSSKTSQCSQSMPHAEAMHGGHSQRTMSLANSPLTWRSFVDDARFAMVGITGMVVQGLASGKEQ